MRTITMEFDYEDLQELDDEDSDAVLLSDEEIHEAVFRWEYGHESVTELDSVFKKNLPKV